MIRIFGTIFAGLMGLAFGSFLNVCLSRWPEGESVVLPRSHCRQCGRTLVWWENVPLVSWLALRGRCRTCRAWIGWRYPLVEFSVAVLWANCVLKHLVVFSILAPHFPLQIINFMLIDAIGTMIFYWLLIALAVLDAENLWLPNWITLPGIALGFLYRLAGAAFLPSFNQTNWLKDHLIGTTAIISLVSIVIAAGLILLIRWTYWLIRRREGVGLGDAKLMALLAAWLGLPQALLAFAVGVMLGSLAAMVVLLVPKARRESGSWAASKLPLGTFLCIGGIVSSLWGQPILSAYLRWAGF